MEIPEVVTRATAFVVFTRKMGSYTACSEKAWAQLKEQLSHLEEKINSSPTLENLELDFAKAEFLGACYDDPKMTEVDRICYDASISWDKPTIDFIKSEGFDTKSIAGGKYAIILHKGDNESLEDSWNELYTWIESNKIELRDEPSFEKYPNLFDKVDASKPFIEIYVPIEYCDKEI